MTSLEGVSESTSEGKSTNLTPESVSEPTGPAASSASTTATNTTDTAKVVEPYDLSESAPHQEHIPKEPTPIAHGTSEQSQEEPLPSLPQRPAPTEPVAPEVAGLQAMFPDFDATILQSVLHSVNGDQERAADVLLGMSDPNYNSQEHGTGGQQEQLSQTELDEQLARRLLLEDQQAQAWHPDQQYPYGPQQGQRGGGQGRMPPGAGQSWNAPWNGGAPNQQQQGGNGRDTMAEVQEQFSKIAETGKKTFSSLVTKVKAKMQEFEQNRNASNSAGGTQPSWGSGTPSRTPPVTQPQPSYYGQTYSSPPDPPHASHPGTTRSASSEQSVTVGGYDASAPMMSASNTPLASAPPPGERIPPRPGSAGPPPAGNVDPTKIGMLPKRPVSLLGTPAQSNTNASHADDDDELEYVENPFEEGRK